MAASLVGAGKAAESRLPPTSRREHLTASTTAEQARCARKVIATARAETRPQLCLTRRDAKTLATPGTRQLSALLPKQATTASPRAELSPTSIEVRGKTNVDTTARAARYFPSSATRPPAGDAPTLSRAVLPAAATQLPRQRRERLTTGDTLNRTARLSFRSVVTRPGTVLPAALPNIAGQRLKERAAHSARPDLSRYSPHTPYHTRKCDIYLESAHRHCQHWGRQRKVREKGAAVPWNSQRQRADQARKGESPSSASFAGRPRTGLERVTVEMIIAQHPADCTAFERGPGSRRRQRAIAFAIAAFFSRLSSAGGGAA